MPYINAEQTKSVRQALKAAFPEYKFSVRKRDNMSLHVTVKSGPVDFNLEDGYCQLNKYWYKQHHAGNEEVIKFAEEFFKVINATLPQKESFHCSDYGSVPNYYQRFAIGDYSTPYEQKAPKAKKARAKKTAKPSYAECFEYFMGGMA